jgi:hypothetical protein
MLAMGVSTGVPILLTVTPFIRLSGVPLNMSLRLCGAESDQKGKKERRRKKTY